MSERLKNKIAIVVGAGSVAQGWGNGKACAVLYAREGAKVLAVDVNLEAAIETKRIIDGDGGECATFKTDVTDSDNVKEMVNKCIESYGRIDILHKVVATARAEAQQRLREQALADGWEEVLNVRLDTAEMTPASRQKGIRAVEVFAYGTGVRYG